MDLNGKVALVLGAVKGIGKVIALTLAEAGAAVAVTYFDWEEELGGLRWDLAAAGPAHLILKINLREVEKIPAAVETVAARFGHLDILQAVNSPLDGLRDLIGENPAHPYALAGLDRISHTLAALKELCEQSDYPLAGSLESNWLLPSATGSLRPTCLAPLTMVAGDSGSKEAVWVVGFQGCRDFYPSWIAANLELQGMRAFGLTLDLPPLRHLKIISSRLLADMLDAGQLQVAIITAMRNLIAAASPFSPARLAFPAVLGLNFPMRVKIELEAGLGLPVFEIPTQRCIFHHCHCSFLCNTRLWRHLCAIALAGLLLLGL